MLKLTETPLEPRLKLLKVEDIPCSTKLMLKKFAHYTFLEIPTIFCLLYLFLCFSKVPYSFAFCVFCRKEIF